MIKTGIAVLAVLIFGCICTFAQCDCPGTVPFGMTVVSGSVNNGRIINPRGSFGFSLDAGIFKGDKLYHKSSEKANTYKRDFSAGYLDANLEYGLSSRSELIADMTYNRFKINDVYGSRRYSVTYLSLLGNYNLIPAYYDDELIAYAGVKIPFGSDLPDSTGTSISYSRKFGFTGNLTWNKMLTGRMNFISSVGGNVFPKFGSENSTGSDAFFRLILQTNGFHNISAGLGASGNYHWKDKIDGKKIDNSGGFLLNAEFSIGYLFKKAGVYAAVNASPALWRNVEGYQIPQKNKLSLTLSMNIK